LNSLPQPLHLLVVPMVGGQAASTDVGPASARKKSGKEEGRKNLRLNPEENPREEDGISNRQNYPTFIPPLTAVGVKVRGLLVEPSPTGKMLCYFGDCSSMFGLKKRHVVGFAQNDGAVRLMEPLCFGLLKGTSWVAE
jgi:hypothetical protein